MGGYLIHQFLVYDYEAQKIVDSEPVKQCVSESAVAVYQDDHLDCSAAL